MKIQHLRRIIITVLFLSSIATTGTASVDLGLRLKELGRFENVRTNALSGYGIVVGLSGSGDSSRNKVTMQSLANVLQEFGLRVNQHELASRNVASVFVTATLPAFANNGDRLDVTVSSIGDARSLRGGTLMRTSLKGVDGRIYSLAQGQIVVGGYNVKSFDSRRSKNHSTVGIVPNGAVVERTLPEKSVGQRDMTYVLDSPDFVTMQRVVDSIHRQIPQLTLIPVTPGKLRMRAPKSTAMATLSIWATLESLRVVPDDTPRIVINERSGIVVAGGDIRLGAAVIAHGGLKIKIDTRYVVSQPYTIGRPSSNISTAVIPDTQMEATESENQSLALAAGSKVVDLVNGLKRLHVPTSDLISILQALRKSGALRAQLIVE